MGFRRVLRLDGVVAEPPPSQIPAHTRDNCDL